MKIDDRVSSYMALLNSETTKPARQPLNAPADQAETGGATVAVDLSESAIQLADDEARRLRLDSIRQQLTEGSYNISGKDVANKILSVLKG
ncbi:MAG: flagellar biosynthesis anti-sigma factor FlgM [Desulfuromonadaceae bacterium]|nr:flagellar biosynthesis anti-sigma factor FlgM [Desulfuromonadaceae bacterium]MDD2856379.1 flagellar biosynthesis anti-sigma factor FlgM [Desulfuromonadaceae bacterium]